MGAYGVTLAILENVETFGNLSGGVKQGFEANGLTTVTLQMDTGEGVRAQGRHAERQAASRYWGGNLSADNLLVLQTLSDIDAPVGVRLWELWYQQKFGDRFDVKSRRAEPRRGIHHQPDRQHRLHQQRVRLARRCPRRICPAAAPPIRSRA